MKYYIATFDDNWADEMDVVGVKVLTEKEKKELDEDIEKYNQAMADDGLCDEWYVGTNESIDPSSVNTPSFHEISETTYKELKSIFQWTFGHFPEYTELIDEDYWEEHFED